MFTGSHIPQSFIADEMKDNLEIKKKSKQNSVKKGKEEIVDEK